MSLMSHEARSQRWYRGIFAGSLGVLCALALGAGCQPTDSAESDDDEIDVQEQGLGGKLSSHPDTDSRVNDFAASPVFNAKVNVPAGVVPTCVNITDGVNGATTQDALLSGDYPGSASGPFFGAWTGVSSGGNMNYSLFKFGLGGLPSGNNVVVTSAKMNIYVSWNPQNSVVGVHKALQPWSEESVTYNSYPASSWEAATVASFSAGGVGTRTFDVTGLAQGWMNGSVANNGVVLEEAPVASHYYFTKEAGMASLRPSLDLCYYINNGPAPWVKVFGGAGTQKVTTVATAADNSVIAAGQFQGSINLGGATFTSGNSEDIFLAKLDATGNHVWSKQLGTAGQYHIVRGSAVAPDGSVYITGEFSGSIDFGGGALSSAATHIFLAKFDATGNHLWSKQFGANGSDAAWSVTAAPNGDVIISGIANIPHPLSATQLSFGGPNAAYGVADAPSSAFVVRLTSSGAYVSQTFRNTHGGQIVKDVTADSLGRIVFAAHMEEGASFCAPWGSVGNASASDYDEGRLSTGLGCSYGSLIGDPFSNDEGTATAVGPGDVAATGGSTGMIAPFGNIVDASYAGIHIRKRGGDGALLWDKKFSLGNVTGLGFDSAGVLSATGTYSGTLNVTGGAALPGNGSYIIRLDANGNGLSQATFGSTVTPADLAVPPDNSSIVVGNFTGTGTFNGAGFTANGTDAFIVKIAP